MVSRFGLVGTVEMGNIEHWGKIEHWGNIEHSGNFEQNWFILFTACSSSPGEEQAGNTNPKYWFAFVAFVIFYTF